MGKGNMQTLNSSYLKVVKLSFIFSFQIIYIFSDVVVLQHTEVQPSLLAPILGFRFYL